MENNENTKHQETNKMGEMPIRQLIFNMSCPVILSMLIQAVYNVVDSFFVAMISEEALAAVTYVFPVQMLMTSVCMGTGVGINSLISRRLGAKRFEDANMAASHGYRISFLNWFLFLIVGIFFSKPIMTVMSDTPNIVENAVAYMQIICIGSLFIMVQISTEKIMQATGNTVLPMICSLIGAVTNIILDPLLIFGPGPFPEMGVTGAAVATIIGQMFSMILGQLFLFKGKHPVKVKLWGWKLDKNIIKEIYIVGAPAILMQSIDSIVLFGMNFILGSLNETAVAVLGVYSRLNSFVFLPVFGINHGVMPIMGYNFGARNRRRLMDAFKKGLFISFVILAIGMMIFQLFPQELLSIFNSQDSHSMYEIGITALRGITWCYLPAAFGIMTSSIFQATGHGFLSMWGSLLRQLVGILPIAWILASISGLDLVWYAWPLSEIIGTVYFVLALQYVYKKEIKPLDEINVSHI